MRKKINKVEVQTVADNLVKNTDKKGHRLVFVEAKPSPINAGEWVVLYDVFSPQETLLDGPMVVIVDSASKEARFMEGP